MKTVQSVVAGERLEHQRHLLASGGWERVDRDGWLAPEHIRDVVALGYGKGSLHLWDALNAQCRYDMMVVFEADAKEVA